MTEKTAYYLNEIHLHEVQDRLLVSQDYLEISHLKHPLVEASSHLKAEIEHAVKVLNELYQLVGEAGSAQDLIDLPELEGLTEREEEVVSMIAAGASNKEIARELSLELSAVRNHVHSILSKYRVRRREQPAAQFRTSSET
jgi:DNA-binding NarL/FixJ family response regulator|tara:strand:- start:54 stop:476 length:423 start_codon:yes stop_codon:yes gene_type:complete